MEIERLRIAGSSQYLSQIPANRNQDYFSSGCQLLDCVLGGGWAENRVANLVGDSSTGKTLLAIEACANFAKKHPTGKIWYAESEASFDSEYASSIGFPSISVDFIDPPLYTIEELHDCLSRCADICEESKEPGFFIIDSIDALSAKTEMERAVDASTYGADRAKKISEVCRRIASRCSRANITILIVSQVRKRIGITFGETRTRAGGEALNFYSSQILWLRELKKIKKTIRKVERVVGLEVGARCKKNKAGLAHRECSIPLIFGYGIDDLVANAEFLGEVLGWEAMDKFGLSKNTCRRQLAILRNTGGMEYQDMKNNLSENTERVWFNLEKEFLPKRGKYNGV